MKLLNLIKASFSTAIAVIKIYYEILLGEFT